MLHRIACSNCSGRKLSCPRLQVAMPRRDTHHERVHAKVLVPSKVLHIHCIQPGHPSIGRQTSLHHSLQRRPLSTSRLHIQQSIDCDVAMSCADHRENLHASHNWTF